MDIRETGMLLAKMSLIDNRQATIETVQAWQEILADIEYQDAHEALLRHWRNSTEWVRPAHIVEGAKIVRRERRKGIY